MVSSMRNDTRKSIKIEIIKYAPITLCNSSIYGVKFAFLTNHILLCKSYHELLQITCSSLACGLFIYYLMEMRKCVDNLCL